MSLAGECSWELLHVCNYRCPYCFFMPSWERAPEDTNRKHLAVAPAQWSVFWRRLRQERGEFLIEVSGGEPFLYPDATALLADVSRGHRLRVITNLFWDPGSAAALSPARVSFLASFHPHFASMPAFESRLAALREAGFESAVMLVAYPPLFTRLAGLKARFESLGFEVLVSPFQGEHAGRPYPESYSPHERDWLRAARPKDTDDDRFELGLRAASPAGRACAAGSRYFRAYPDGALWRCVSLKDMAGARPIGRVQDGAVELHDGSSPCPVSSCVCPAEYRQLAPAEAA